MLHEYELLRAVAPNNDITLLSSFHDIGLEDIRTAHRMGLRVELVEFDAERAERPRSRFSRLARLLLRAAGPTIMVSNRRKRIPLLAEVVAAETAACPYDAVALLLGDFAPLSAATKTNTALLLFDVYARQTAHVSSGYSARAIRFRLEAWNARWWERKWYRRADGVACVSDVDAKFAEELTGRSVAVVPNPIPDEFFAPPRGERSAATVTFVGSLGWEPNIDSVRWLTSEIWPKIQEKRPDARLVIVGRHAQWFVNYIVENAGGEFFSNVPDILPYYWEAAVVVAPVRMGSGTRNKVLHAMAARAPVVATTAALEGIPARHDEHLLVADDAQGLADAVLEALNDPEAARARAERAVPIAEAFSAAGAGRALQAFWEETARVRPVPSPADVRTDRSASIVICTRERPQLLERCLRAVAVAAAEVPGTEVVIVEQGAPSAARICAEIGLDALVVSDEGVGASRARNIGAETARGEVVLFTDDDCEVPPGWVRSHLYTLRDREVAASFGRVGGLRLYEEDDPTTIPLRHRKGIVPWRIGHASNMAVFRADLLAVGGFDERLGPGIPGKATGEDADLIARLLRAGYFLATGGGDAVSHVDWRSETDQHSNLVDYEYGAGLWIGKAFREEPRQAARFRKERFELLEWNIFHAKRIGEEPPSTAEFRRAFRRGFWRGVRMKPWRGPSRSKGDPPIRVTETKGVTDHAGS
jgi:glycosyltransferase involved in cell wall biosynthesis